MHDGAFNVRQMTDRATLADDGGQVFAAVQYGVVLNGGVGADSDFAVVATQHRTRPDGRSWPDDHVSDNDGLGHYECRRVNLWLFVSQRINGHGRTLVPPITASAAHYRACVMACVVDRAGAMDRIGAVTPPLAQQREHVRRAHGTETVDPWFWLRDRDDPAVEAYLHAENAYTEHATAHLAALRATLFAQLRSRISETHDSLAVPNGSWEYFTRTVAELAYPIYMRRRISETHASAGDGDRAEDTVLLDVNLLARDHDYFALGDLAVSPNQNLLAYTADTAGNELYELFVLDIATGETTECSGELTYGLAWANDNRTLFVVGVDEAQRSNRVMRCVPFERAPFERTQFEEVFKEDDERFWVGISKTRSERFVVVASESETTSECHLLDADHPRAELVPVRMREPGVEYRVDHQGSQLLIVTNSEGSHTFCLKKAALQTVDSQDSQTARGEVSDSALVSVGEWEPLLEHHPDTRLYEVDCFESFAVLEDRTNATTRLRLLKPGSSEPLDLPLPGLGLIQDSSFESPYEISTSTNLEYAADSYRYKFTSMTTPSSVYEINVAEVLASANSSAESDASNSEARLLYQSPVAVGVDLSAYETLRVWATSKDGTRVPISLVWRPDPASDLVSNSASGSPPQPAPCLLYGYGAYEVSIPAAFSSAQISLLDRGVVFAIAHVRGGGEMGRAWYDAGRLEQKQNTFDDFVACARHLIAQGWTEPDRLVARGASAGGLLMGAIFNQAPELFAGVVAEVPFVDALNTMLDPTIPLTVTEFDQWGDPSQADSFKTIQSYAPYENVNPPSQTGENRPALLATAGLHDPRVPYWEPAKWVAKLRANAAPTAADSAPNPAQRPILLRTQMSAGHGGATGRYDAWREEAFIQAFVLDVMGLAKSDQRAH